MDTKKEYLHIKMANRFGGDTIISINEDIITDSYSFMYHTQFDVWILCVVVAASASFLYIQGTQ